MRLFDSNDRGPERGQILVIFALALVAMLAMVGLVLDGGSAFAQRRDQQNAADLAALAGANDYLLNSNATDAYARARAVASQNGYADGADGVTVNVSLSVSNGARVQVDITAPHPNTFARVIPGQQSWQVSTTATAKTGIPDSVEGAGPFIFSIRAFGTLATALAVRRPGQPVRLRRDEWRRPDVEPRPRLDQLRNRESQLERGPEHHRGRPCHQQDDPVRGVHRAAQQRQPHDAVHGREHAPQRRRRPDPGRGRQRQLPGLGHVPRRERLGRLRQAHPWLLREPIPQRSAHRWIVRRRELPAIPGVLVARARELTRPRPGLRGTAPGRSGCGPRASRRRTGSGRAEYA